MFKRLYQSLLSLFVKRAESEWIGAQALPKASGYQEYEVSDEQTINAPFDGYAVLFADSVNKYAIRYTRVSCQNVYSSAYATGKDMAQGMQYTRTWIPISKGTPVSVIYGANDTLDSAVLRFVKTRGTA